MKTLESLVRPNIWALKPYSCARDEFKGMDAHVFLDANESPYNEPLNRYPDPLQENVKQAIETMTGLSVVEVNVHVQGVGFPDEEPKDDEIRVR